MARYTRMPCFLLPSRTPLSLSKSQVNISLPLFPTPFHVEKGGVRSRSQGMFESTLVGYRRFEADSKVCRCIRHASRDHPALGVEHEGASLFQPRRSLSLCFSDGKKEIASKPVAPSSTTLRVSSCVGYHFALSIRVRNSLPPETLHQPSEATTRRLDISSYIILRSLLAVVCWAGWLAGPSLSLALLRLPRLPYM